MPSLSRCIAVFFVLTAGTSVAQAPRIMVNLMGHSAKIHNLLFTPDGRKIISISEDKTIRVWDAETGSMIKKFESQIGDGPEGMLYCSAISPDGKLLAASGYPVAAEKQNYIIIIDLEKGTQVATAIGHSNVINSLSFDGKGTYLASGGDDAKVYIWKVNNEKVLKTITTIPLPSRAASLSINPKTNDLAVSCDSRDILVYNLSGIRKLTPRIFKNHKGIVTKVAYSPDGNYLASGSLNNELILWRPDGSVVKNFEGITSPINALAFSYDAKILAGLDITGKGMSWSIPSGVKFTDYHQHNNTVFSAAFAPSITGSYLVASAGGIDNEILLWNPINGHTVKHIRGKGKAIGKLAFGEGLELFISHGMTNNKNPKYNTSFNFSSLTVNRHPGRYTSPASGGHAETVVQTGTNTLKLAKGKVIQTDENIDGRMLDFRVLDDGSVIVASDFSLKMFDKSGFLSKEFVGHSGAVRTIAITADGKYMASGGEDQSIILWKLSETGYAPSLREVFTENEWQTFFSSLPNDSLTTLQTKKAWKDIIDFLKNHGNKTYKDIEAVYRDLGETVIPFATLFIAEDNEWVCWTPAGYFACSSFGSQYFGWHVNRGISQLADFYAAEQYFEILYQPKALGKAVTECRRVEDILRDAGERIFDLTRLHRPSAALFEISPITRTTDLLKYDKGRFFTDARTIPLMVEIFDGGGGVKSVEVYQNDKLIISDDSIRTSGEGEKVIRTYTVEMGNETNVFKVKVINYQKIESRPDMLTIDYRGEVIATSTLHILAVGINKYKNASYNLNYAQPDAASFTEKIKAQGQTIFKRINAIEIYDEDATKEHILMGFRSVIAQARPEDVFLFYYAGHGTLDEERNDEYYLVPTDITKLYGDPAQLQTRGISATELKAHLTQVKSQKQIILMDACHSGGALKTLNVRAAATDEKAIVQLARSSGVVMIASSGTKQFATEFDQLKHGVFTYSLLEALDGKGDNGDKKITVNELKFYMEERVPELTRQYGGQAQYPTGYITGNDFPISIIK